MSDSSGRKFARARRRAGAPKPQAPAPRNTRLHYHAPPDDIPNGDCRATQSLITDRKNPEEAISVAAATDSGAQVKGKGTEDVLLSTLAPLGAETIWQGVGGGSNSPKSAPISFGQRSTLFFLVVAVDEAIHDCGVLQRAFGPSTLGNIHFARILGKVTFESLKAKVKQLYNECTKTPGSELFILLTGHGDKSNRMVLSDQEFIDETDLFGLVRELQETRSKLIPVTILFDICRESEQPSVDTLDGVSLIWTCSPGEYAHALRLPYGPDIPSSCFLLALMMDSRTPGFAQTEDSLKTWVKEQLDQLVEYLKEVHLLRHSEGTCPACSTSNRLCEKPKRQNVDWNNAKNMKGILKLVKVLSSTKAAHEVHHRVVMDSIFRRANRLQDPIKPCDHLRCGLWPIDEQP